MGLLPLLARDPATFLILAGGLTAWRFGDDTAKNSGRLSLNPLLHLDPLGTAALFLVGFGWAKPVPVDYSKLSNSRFGLVAVALSGCAVNFAIATVATFLLQFTSIGANSLLGPVFGVAARINILLGVFNLIPIPPLDGSKVLMGFLPHEAQRSLARVEPYGFLTLIALLFTGVLDPVINSRREPSPARSAPSWEESARRIAGASPRGTRDVAATEGDMVAKRRRGRRVLRPAGVRKKKGSRQEKEKALAGDEKKRAKELDSMKCPKCGMDLSEIDPARQALILPGRLARRGRARAGGETGEGCARQPLQRLSQLTPHCQPS